jgi:hypothetical protein
LANVPRSLRNTSIKAAGSSSKAGNGPSPGMTSSRAGKSTERMSTPTRSSS